MQFQIFSFSKYKNLKETLKFYVPFVFSLIFKELYISVLESYISNLGARPVLVCFWDYIFWIWITVSLPRGRIQEIKRMLLVNLTHGLFLT
jgi:hypothetical protein